MKKLTVSIVLAIALASCQSEAGKQAEIERQKAQAQYDSIKKQADMQRQCLTMKLEFMQAGATEKDACDKVKQLKPTCDCK